MSAPKGNQYNKKLSTPELKKLAYEQYCAHIASGKSHKSWYFEHPDLTLSWQSMESYLKREPHDFNPLHKEIAMAKSLDLYEKRGDNLIESEKRCQPAIYQMFMRNKFGWDKDTPEEKEEKAKRAQAILHSIYDDLHKEE